MEDLIAKIEELKKTLTSFKTSQPDPLKPAIGMASQAVKPTKMVSTGAIKTPKPTKLPGTTTASKKDPKAVAAQLRAGKAPKSAMPKGMLMQSEREVCKFDKNGQWSLV